MRGREVLPWCTLTKNNRTKLDSIQHVEQDAEKYIPKKFLAQKAVEKSAQQAVDFSESRALSRRQSGLMVGTNGRIYKSPKRTAALVWKNVGNQHFTTKGVKHDQTPQLLGRTYVWGKRIAGIAKAAGLGFTLLDLAEAHKVGSNPFELIPIPCWSMVCQILDDRLDQLNAELLRIACIEGYSSASRMIKNAGSGEDYGNYEPLEKVSTNLLSRTANGKVADFSSLLETHYEEGNGNINAVFMVRPGHAVDLVLAERSQRK